MVNVFFYIGSMDKATEILVSLTNIRAVNQCENIELVEQSREGEEEKRENVRKGKVRREAESSRTARRRQ